MSPDRVSRIIEQELDTTIEDLFESIDLKNPLGAASIAQVKAHMRSMFASQLQMSGRVHLPPASFCLRAGHINCTAMPVSNFSQLCVGAAY